DQVWANGGAGALDRFVTSPREALLAELGRAQRLVPALAEALRTAHPAALELDAPGAHAFLSEGAATLSAAGFGVEVPGWWGRPAARLGARLTAGTPSQPGSAGGAAGLGQAALVDYRWEVALGDHSLTQAELKALAELQQPLVRLRGQWVEVDAHGLQRALKAMQRNGSGQMSVADLFGALAAGDMGPSGLPVLDVQASGWLGDLLSGSVERRLEPVAAPADFGGTLRPYQERGLAWLTFLDEIGLGAVLADDMGLGKTVQLLALIARDRADDRATDPAADRVQPPSLLVCPMSLVGNWQREAARFVPDLRVHVHHGADRARGEAFEAAVASSDLVLTTYAIAARDVASLGAVGWRRVVLDEAQAVKNAATKQAAAVRALPAAHRIAVTGTPVENRLADLWSIMEFANPGLLGGATAFRDRFAVPIERHGDDDAAARLRTLTQPFLLRRLKTDRSIISDLPEKLEMDVFCSLTTEQAALYQATVDDMIEKIEASDGIERRGLVLATMTKLKQVCNHPAQLLRDGSRLAGRSGKLARVEETLEEVLAAGEKALLFTQFAEFGGMLRAHLSARFGREVLFLHGGVAKADRDTMVARFSADDASSPPLFVLSLKAGGTGLNLTAANHVLHVDRWWNPAVEDQATDRAFRIGQRRAVQVRKLVCAGTVEERIAEMIREKRGLAARIVGTGEGWLTELSTSQLRELLRLDRSAVPE
ncbi:MAG TPA: DEAD/DEAH box helicase, partial [Kineosporiaceae bacterium]|nr:DEAD/DEAH box helicase [Kineosporiaceae bacterium]